MYPTTIFALSTLWGTQNHHKKYSFNTKFEIDQMVVKFINISKTTMTQIFNSHPKETNNK